MKNWLKVFMAQGLLLSSMSVARVLPNEQNIINTPAEEAHRCWEISAEKCREERENWYKRGCISRWAKDELAKKKSSIGEDGGFPICDGSSELRKWCYCGCFHPETLLLVYDKLMSDITNVMAKDIAKDTLRYDLVVLAEDSTIQQISFSQLRIDKITHSLEKDPLVIIHLENGRVLRLSSQHAVMLSNGKMVVAEELRANDLLIDLDGKPTLVEEIFREHSDLEVINFMTSGESLPSHILIAEGMIVGDLAWQNELVPLLNVSVLENRFLQRQ